MTDEHWEDLKGIYRTAARGLDEDGRKQLVDAIEDLALRFKRERVRGGHAESIGGIVKPDMTWRTNADGLCTDVSMSWCRFVGRDIQQELGLGWLDHLRVEDRERVITEVAQAYRVQKPFLVCYQLRRHDGQWTLMRSRGMPWVDPTTGEFAGYWGSVTPHAAMLCDRSVTPATVVSLAQRLVSPALLGQPPTIASQLTVHT